MMNARVQAIAFVVMPCVAWTVAYFVASNIYPRICTPWSIYGFFMSPMMVTTPQCVALRWVIDTGATTIITMWKLVGLWIAKRVLFNR